MKFHDYGMDLKNPDFVKYAQAYGAEGHRITRPDDFNKTLQHCFSTKAVHVVEIPIDYSVSDHLQVSITRNLYHTAFV
jgi:acetolactate synthase I/II/III large subunit